MADLPYDLQNRDLGIRTILSEDPSMDGSVAVAAVLLNRLAAGKWGSTIDDVTTAREQFEGLYDAVQKMRRGESSVFDISTDDPRYIRVGQALDALATGAMPDPTSGATHFYSPSGQAARGRTPPSWAYTSPGQTIGGQVYFAPEGRSSYQALRGVTRQPYYPHEAGVTDAEIPAWMKGGQFARQLPDAATRPPRVMRGPNDVYSSIPAVDDRGENQIAKFMRWNPDPIGTSAARLAQVHPDIQAIVRKAMSDNPNLKFIVGSGVRSPEDQKLAYQWGWSTVPVSPSHPDVNQRGIAVDLWGLDDKGRVQFVPEQQAQIASAMKRAATELGMPITWGGDWRTFKDRPHFQLDNPRPGYRPGSPLPPGPSANYADTSSLTAEGAAPPKVDPSQLPDWMKGGKFVKEPPPSQSAPVAKTPDRFGAVGEAGGAEAKSILPQPFDQHVTDDTADLEAKARVKTLPPQPQQPGIADPEIAARTPRPMKLHPSFGAIGKASGAETEAMLDPRALSPNVLSDAIGAATDFAGEQIKGLAEDPFSTSKWLNPKGTGQLTGLGKGAGELFEASPFLTGLGPMEPPPSLPPARAWPLQEPRPSWPEERAFPLQEPKPWPVERAFPNGMPSEPLDLPGATDRLPAGAITHNEGTLNQPSEEPPPALHDRPAVPSRAVLPEHLDQFKPSLRQAREPEGSEPAPDGAPARTTLPAPEVKGEMFPDAKVIGKNAEGKDIYERPNGVRAYFRDDGYITSNDPNMLSGPGFGPSQRLPDFEVVAPNSTLPPHLEDFKPSKRAAGDVGPKAVTDEGQSIGAARAPPPVMPPQKQWVSELEDRLNRYRGAQSANKPDVMQTYIDPLPEEFSNPDVQLRWDRYGQGDPTAILTDHEREGFEKYYRQKLGKEQEDNYIEAMDLKKKYGAGVSEEDVNPHYMRRNVKGMSPQFDPRDEGNINPIGGRRGLPQSTSSMEERKFFAIENPVTGERRVVAHLSDGDWMVVEKGNSYEFALPKDMKLGDVHTMPASGAKWQLKSAYTREISSVGGPEYHENAMANGADNILRQRAVLDGLYLYRDLTQSPEWHEWARSAGGDEYIPEGYRVPKMRLFNQWYVDPRLADALDNYHGYEPAFGDWMARANRFGLKTMFLSPTAHWLNVLWHWAAARGFDWIKPRGIYSLAVDGAAAFKHVWSMSKKYQEILRNSGGLLYSDVIHHDFLKSVMHKLGDDIVVNPTRWQKIANNYGLGIPQLVKAWYGGVQKALWYASDVMLVQRVLELERKGMTTREAVKDAHRHIPSYQVPSRVAENFLGAKGSQRLSRILQDQSIMAFGRYHYGVMNSYSNMGKDLFGPPAKNAIGESRRIEGIGTLLVTSGILAFVNPYLQWAWRESTGQKDDVWKARGPTSLLTPFVDHFLQSDWIKEHAPKWLTDYYDGKTDVMTALSTLMMIPPGTRTVVEALPFVNKDFFTGKPVAEPDDINNNRWFRVLGEEAEHFSQPMIQPYEFARRAGKMSTATDALGYVEDVLGQFGKSALNITKRNTEGIETAQEIQAQQALKRSGKDTDPFYRTGNALQTYWDSLFSGGQ